MMRERAPRASGKMPKPKFYLDESVGVWVGDVLGRRGHNVKTAEQANLIGRADSDHFAYCWRHGRVLVSHDFDFFDYKNPELPDIRNPGVIVLDCDSGNARAIEALLTLLPRITDLVGEFGWKHTRTIAGPTGRVTIRRRARNSGAYEIERYKFTREGFVARETPTRSRGR